MLGPEKGYLDILDEHIMSQAEKSAGEQRVYSPLRPSAAGKCVHELATEYAQYKGLLPTKQEVISPELSRIFSLGHSIEWMMIREMEKVPGFKIKYKQQVVRFGQLSDGTNLEGSLDLTIFFNGHGGICDWKSKKDRFSGYGATGWNEADEGYGKMASVEQVSDSFFWINDLQEFLSELRDPWLKPNFLQLNLYACTPFIKESGIDHASLFYFNKNDCRLREMRFRPSEEVYEQTKAKFNKVHDLVTSINYSVAGEDSVQLAKYAAEVVNGTRCPVSSNCNYCWPDEAKRAYFSTLPPKKWAKDTSYLGKNGEEIEALFLDYQDTITQMATGEVVHDAIVKKMLDLDETKIRLANGEVWEAKFLKSPRPHHELRRSK